MIRTEKHADTRSIHAELECDAPVAAVWKALIDERELINWFPFAAHIDPKIGGRYAMSWRGMFEWIWENKIEILEPEKRLRLILNRTEAQLAKGTPLHVMEYTLEAKGDKTVLRLVESGFSNDQSWDNEFESHTKGWTYELMALAHYLKYHRGQKRAMVCSTVTGIQDQQDAMNKLLMEFGITATKPGQAVEIVISPELKLMGCTIQYVPGWQYAGEIENMNRALFRVGAEDDFAFVWISFYDLPGAELRTMQHALDRFMSEHFVDETRRSPMIQPFSPTAGDSQLVGLDFGWV